MAVSLPLGLLTMALVMLLLYQLRRRSELASMRRTAEERLEARERGSHKAQLQHPFVDLSRCFGCGACVKACPEEGVLGLIHGQAAVLHGARCVGHGLCAAACPVDAIALTLGDVTARKDIPALTETFEAVGTPNLFLAGEVSGHALIRTAISHGTAVADEIASRLSRARPMRDVLDVCIVGAGPAGLACSLQAKARALEFVVLERDSLGGTVSRYPRRKLVMTQPVELPLYGRLSQTSYEKEELIGVWEEVARSQNLPVRTGVEFLGLERDNGTFTVKTNQGDVRARTVVLALGRRGTPRKLGVPGEDLPKVAYNLIDAQAYQWRKILVVGGGDSAIEAAIALGEQAGNRVTLSYRQAAFSRLKAKNEKRLDELVAQGHVHLLLESNVVEIAPNRVKVKAKDVEQELPNDDVFIMAGGTPPFALLEKSGVSFDLSKAPPPPRMVERGADAVRGAAAALLFVAAAWVWFGLFRNYYPLPEAQRALHPLHEVLKSSGSFGLGCALAATFLLFANLLYLPRRWFGSSSILGSLRAWMTSHIATGTLAFLLLLFHAALSPRPTAGGYALAALTILAITGAVGRYFYAFVPRAANGREAALEDLRAEMAAQSAEWDRHGRGFADEAREELRQLVESAAWGRGFLGGLVGLVREQHRLRRVLHRLRARGREQGLSRDQLEGLLALTERAHRTAMMAARFESLRGILETWRHLHRWLAVVMITLAVVHVATAVRYANIHWPWRP
jgi:putative YpdA family bacillithiol system oxidoreductase